MFNRTRLSLTAWYVLVLLAIIAVIGALTYIAFARSLSGEVDDSIESSARAVAAQLDEEALESISGASRGHGGEEEEDDEHGVRFFTPSGGDTFYFVLSPDGTELVNPSNVSVENIPDASAARRAVDGSQRWTTVDSGGVDYRLFSLPVQHDGETMAVVQAGRSLSEQSRQLTGLLLVLGLTGAGGLALAALGGLFVSGLSLRPVREAFIRQRAFVADASHELRTPLTIIRGNAEMIGLSPTARLAEEDRAALDDVVSQAAYMERLVADLSLLARLDESRLPLNMEQIEIAELLQTAGRSARTLAAQKNITVEVRAQGGAAIKGDGMRLQELLLALIDNAVRYTPPGGRITIEAQDGGAPAIRVSDTGPGIPQEQMSRIFERFSRGDEARSRDGGGTGLGLSVAQAIAHAHGGKITAQNSASGGAVFTLVLPAV